MKSDMDKKTENKAHSGASAKKTATKAAANTKKKENHIDGLDVNDKRAVTAKKAKVPAKKAVKKSAPKKKDIDEEKDFDENLNEMPVRKMGSKKSSKKDQSAEDDELDDEDLDHLDDEFNNEIEDDFAIDKEFEEFELPKSKTKLPKKKSSKGDFDDVDDEFKDLGIFHDTGGGFDDDDDF